MYSQERTVNGQEVRSLSGLKYQVHTWEVVKGGKISFLDTSVYLEDDCKTSIKTVYRKPTNKDQYLHFAYGNTPSNTDYE